MTRITKIQCARRRLVWWWACGLVLAGMCNSPASTYEVGDTVQDFSLYARRAFTNDVGTVIPAGSPVRLSDFSGKIVFLEFFYYW